MSSKVLIGGAIVVTLGLFVIVGFSGGSSPSYGASIGHGALGSGSQKNQVPNLTLKKLGGGEITLSEFTGKKSVVVDFWASWCPNCRRDMPNLNRFYEKYKDDVEVIGVNLRESESTVQNFINSLGISFPIALDPRGEASRAFGIQYTNTHFLIDINGNIVRMIPGDIREADIVSLIEQSNTLKDQAPISDE